MGSKSKGHNKPRKDEIQQAAKSGQVSDSKVIIQEQHLSGRSGPIPSPDDLERYNSIIPDGANRIMSMAETQANHRQKLEDKIVDAQIADAKSDRRERLIGQIFALLIGTIAIISGAVLAAKDQQWAGGFIGTGGVVGLVYVFIAGRKAEKIDAEGD